MDNEKPKKDHEQRRPWHKLRQLTDKEKKLFFKLALCLLVGIVLMSLTRSASDHKADQAATDQEVLTQQVVGDYYSEEAALEAKLVSILSEVKGAGKVAVALTFEEGTESVYAEEENQTIGSDQSESSSALAAINDNPVLIKQRLPKVLGLVIVAEGAGDPLVKERLYQAASSLLGLNAAQVAVIEGNVTP